MTISKEIKVMSYIEKTLKGGQSNTEIVDFLLKEGFKYGTGALGEGKMYYVVCGELHTVWFALCDDYISLYAEYDCGGEVGSDQFYFNENEF
jgi:hypothetical protein